MAKLETECEVAAFAATAAVMCVRWDWLNRDERNAIVTVLEHAYASELNVGQIGTIVHAAEQSAAALMDLPPWAK